MVTDLEEREPSYILPLQTIGAHMLSEFYLLCITIGIIQCALLWTVAMKSNLVLSNSLRNRQAIIKKNI